MKSTFVRSCLAALLLAGTAFNAHAQEEVIVGAATSLSGWMGPFDKDPTRTAELAIADINAAGGLLGKRLKLVHIDTKTDQALTSKAAQDLVKQGAKLLLIACDFDSGAPAALVGQKANVISISSCGADFKYGNLTIGNNVFTAATDAAATGRILADWGTRKKGWKKAYILLDTFIEYDKSLCRGFKEQWQALHGKDGVVLEDTFKNADVSVASQISRYNASGKKADVIMLCSVPPGLASTLRQYRAAGIDLPVLAGTGGAGNALHSAVPGLTNYFFLNNSADGGVTDPNPANEEFFKRFEKRFGERPAVGQGITGYTVVQAWARAVEKAGSFDTNKVRAELEKFKDEPLIGGLTSFTPKLHTNVDRPMLIISVDGNKREALGYYDIRKGDFVTWW
ncbi:MAG: ABC transporter substrate-binding protein [Burkholderiales bacterium]|nr:ABC transporter substrate-binding protein [Burkholderiales bacterium]